MEGYTRSHDILEEMIMVKDVSKNLVNEKKNWSGLFVTFSI